MKIVFEKVARSPDRSFATVDKRARAFDGRFHFHPEIEITLIESSSGRRVVGDSIEPFAPGDLVMLGPNLPHQYVSDPPSSDTIAAAKVIQFAPDWGDKLSKQVHFNEASVQSTVFYGVILLIVLFLMPGGAAGLLHQLRTSLKRLRVWLYSRADSRATA